MSKTHAAEPAPVTVIGLGLMGTALAEAFLRRGHPTTVWNRSPEKADGLVAKGAVRADTVEAAVTASPLVVVCVLDYAAVHTILDPVTEALAGRTMVNLTSGSPSTVRTTAVWAAEHGIDYLDGAIMMTPSGIGAPETQLLYSGDAAAFDRHEDTLRALGGLPTFLSDDPGLAALYDLALLSIMYSTLTGFLHATALVNADKVSATEFVPFATGWLTGVTSFLPEMAKQVDDGDYSSREANLAMQFNLWDEFARVSAERGIDDQPMTYVGSLIERAIAGGHGQDDFASVIEVIRTSAARR